MGLRERAERFAPGVFRSPGTEIVQASVEQDYMPQVRASTVSLYGGGFGTPIIVPNLDAPRQSAGTPNEEMPKNPLLFAPIWRMASRIGGLPIKVYRFQSEGGRRKREEAQDHAAYKLLRAPNPDLTRNLLISGTVVSMFTFGRSGWLKERENPFGPRLPSNPIIALWPIPGNVLFPKRTDKRLLEAFELRTFGYPPVTIPAADVCYFRLMPDVNDWGNGTTPAAPLGDILEFGASGMSAMTKMFRSALLQRLWLDMHGADLDDDLRERLRAELELAARNPYGVPIIEGGASIETMGEGPNHELLKASLEMAKEVVRHTFGFPEDNDNLQHFYAEVVQPVADAMEQEWERSLLPDFREEVFAEFQFREILAGSPDERAKLHQTRIISGQETPNEARAAENLGPIAGGDKLYIPLNMIPVDETPVDRNARPRDSAGGLGGNQGKGTIPKIAGGKRVRGEDDTEPDDGGDNTNARTDRWRTARERVLTSQADGLERRLRGALNHERNGLRELMAPLGQVPARKRLEAGTFTEEGVRSVMDGTDTVLRDLLDRFMAATVTSAASLAASLMRSPDELFQTTPVDDTVFQIIRARVESMTAHFRERRQEHFDRLVEGELSDSKTLRHADEEIRGEWTKLTDHLVRMIGETETKWAFERGASHGWARMGVQELGVVKEGDHCSSGVCLEVVTAGRFRTSDVPTPLHPGCQCFVVPAQLVG